MKRIILLIVFVLALLTPAWAQSTNRIILHGSATGAAVGNQPFGLSWNGATITVKGTFTGLTAVAKVSSDGITFSPVSVTNLYGLTASTSITAAGVYFMPVGRAYMFDVEVTAIATGSVDIYATPTDQVLAKGGGGAPIDATFITQTPSSTLSAEQALSALATGLLKNTTTTGVLSIAGASDLPSGIDAAKIADGSVSNAEFQRLDGVTSGIQTQIDGKQAALTLGTGVTTALGVNVGSAGALVVNGGAGGTPSSLTLTNATGLPVGGITGFGTGIATFLATPSSANLAAAVTDETGSGAAVFANTPTLITPILGAATATTINGNTFTTGTYTLTGTAGKTLNFLKSLTLDGTDGTTQTFPSTSATIARTDAGQTFTGNQRFDNQVLLGGTTTGITQDSSGIARITNGSTGYGSLYVGNTGLQVYDGTNFKIGLNPVGASGNGTLTIASNSTLNWSSSVSSGGTADLIMRRIGAANFGIGAVANATPVANTLTIGESGSGTNIAGGAGTIQSGTGTGTGTVATLIFQTPTLGSSGTTAQSYATRLTLDSTNATFGGQLLAPTGSASAPTYSFSGVTNTGFYNRASATFAITVAGTIGVDITASQVRIPSNSIFGWSASTADQAFDTQFRRAGAANPALGAADAASPVAQTLSVQNVVAGTADTAGVATTIIGSLSTGSGASGDVIIKTGGTGAGSTAQNSATTALTIKGATQNIVVASTTDSTTTTSGALQVAGGAAVLKRVFIPGITTSSGLQTAVLCQSSGGEMIADSVACLASSGRFKQDIKPLAVGLDEVMRLRPVSYRYKQEGIFAHNANYLKERIGFLAEDVEQVEPRVVGYEADGKTVRTVSYETMVPLLVKSIQELKGEVDALKTEIQSLKSKRVPFYLPSVIGL